LNASLEPTVILILYSEEATVEETSPAPSLDNTLKRSSASDSTFTDAERPKRSWPGRKIKRNPEFLIIHKPKKHN